MLNLSSFTNRKNSEWKLGSNKKKTEQTKNTLLFVKSTNKDSDNNQKHTKKKFLLKSTN